MVLELKDASLWGRPISKPTGLWEFLGRAGMVRIEDAGSPEPTMALGKTFYHANTAFQVSAEQLHRLFVVMFNCDPLRCHVCKRKCRGIWQVRKHLRTAHKRGRT